MRTVAEIDGKIEEHLNQIDQLKELRKQAAAKERQQTRKWRGMCLTAIGETVVRSIGCDWAELDLDGLQEALSDTGGELLAAAVIEGRPPTEAKRALDAFKRSRRESRPVADEGEKGEEPVEAQTVEDAGQTNPW